MIDAAHVYLWDTRPCNIAERRDGPTVFCALHWWLLVIDSVVVTDAAQPWKL